MPGGLVAHPDGGCVFRGGPATDGRARPWTGRGSPQRRYTTDAWGERRRVWCAAARGASRPRRDGRGTWRSTGRLPQKEGRRRRAVFFFFFSAPPLKTPHVGPATTARGEHSTPATGSLATGDTAPPPDPTLRRRRAAAVPNWWAAHHSTPARRVVARGSVAPTHPVVPVARLARPRHKRAGADAGSTPPVGCVEVPVEALCGRIHTRGAPVDGPSLSSIGAGGRPLSWRGRLGRARAWGRRRRRGPRRPVAARAVGRRDPAGRRAAAHVRPPPPLPPIVTAAAGGVGDAAVAVGEGRKHL